ncbi:MAG: NlpC/P60 family protein, partial [Chitinophagales bacterium]
MIKKIISGIMFVFLLGSCSSLKHLGFSNDKALATSTSVSPLQNPAPAKKQEVKFLDNISTNPPSTITEPPVKSTKGPGIPDAIIPKTVEPTPVLPVTENTENNLNNNNENLSALQAKYAVLMNTNVESVQNLKLFEYIDEWYGTRYCMGGTTKNCIDCSAFVQELFAVVYDISLPRTSKDQYLA